MTEFVMSANKAQARQTKKRIAISKFCWHNSQALLTSLRWFKQSPLITIMTFCVIGITLALPAGLFVLLYNVQAISKDWHGSGQITLYLQQHTSKADIDSLMQTLQLRSDVATVNYISPQAGMQNFANQSGFGDILSQLPNNPLPPVIEVIPAVNSQQPQLMQQQLQELQHLPFIESAKLDLQWLTRLQAIVAMGKQSVTVLFCFFAFAVLLVVGYSIRLTTQTQQQVINVMQLMGATTNFIRHPFLYAGSLYGLIGACIAWGLIAVGIHYIQPSMQHLIDLYQGTFQVQSLSFIDGFALLLLGTSLGWISAYLVLAMQVKAHA